MLPQSQLKGPKKKSYPLLGEPEMADELNKIERSRPTGYRVPNVNRAPTAKSPIRKKMTSGRDTPLPSSDGIVGGFIHSIRKK